MLTFEIFSSYGTSNLKFGKVELSRNPNVAAKYKINTSPLSKQMPTLILFKDGLETMRRPLVNDQGKLVTFNFNYVSHLFTSHVLYWWLFPQSNIVSTFGLDELKTETKQTAEKTFNDKSKKSKNHLKAE